MSSDLEARVQRLIDIEDIKQLKARYAAYCDDDYNADGLAALFAEDAVWDGAALGYAEGQEQIREFFRKAPATVSFAVHTVTNPLIEIDGSRATGRWYLWQPMVLRDAGACMWLCAQYDDRYVRSADGWLFEHVKITIRAFSPYEEGFGKVLVGAVPVE
jgi:hypothetical protein